MKKKKPIRKKNLPRLLETLDRWGVRNLRALAALPEIALSERLGQEGLRLQQLARGAASRTLVPVERLRFLKKQSNWNIPSCCWSLWPFC